MRLLLTTNYTTYYCHYYYILLLHNTPIRDLRLLLLLLSIYCYCYCNCYLPLQPVTTATIETMIITYYDYCYYYALLLWQLLLYLLLVVMLLDSFVCMCLFLFRQAAALPLRSKEEEPRRQSHATWGLWSLRTFWCERRYTACLSFCHCIILHTILLLHNTTTTIA